MLHQPGQSARISIDSSASTNTGEVKTDLMKSEKQTEDNTVFKTITLWGQKQISLSGDTSILLRKIKKYF